MLHKRIFRTVISAFLALCIGISMCACGKQAPAAQKPEITIPFSFGERTGSYIGSLDENNLPHGMGSFTSKTPDGVTWTYSGQWEHGHMNGQGVTEWSNGESLAGTFSDDSANGIAIDIKQNGISVAGKYVDGVATGYCAMYLSGDYDGYVFWGNLGQGDGTGVVYLPSGETVPAELTNGQLKFNPYDVQQAETPKTATLPEPLPTEETTSDEVQTETTETGLTTMGERNALRQASNYLSLMGFSYSGLIRQLEYEGYSTEEATYAADHCGADWNAQAAKKAKSYLDFMSFSRSGLIAQLEFDGFTSEQAKYGAEANGY